MLRPFLLVGVGGSGGKTLRAMRVVLERKLVETHGWDGSWPEAWQMLHFDTPTNQADKFPAAPFLAPNLYRGLAPENTAYEALAAALVGQAHSNIRLPKNDMNRFADWMPHPAAVITPLQDGAGQFRAIGRAVAVSKLKRIHEAVVGAVGRLQSAEATNQLNDLASKLGMQAGGVATPAVIVISSLAGGSGAGAFIDVMEAIKIASGDQWLQRPIAFLYTAEVFESLGKGVEGTAANALAALCESMSGLWAGTPTPETIDLYQGLGLIPSIGAGYVLGARHTFLIGRRNSLGIDFLTPDAVFTAVASSLGALISDEKVQDQFWNYYLNNLEATGSSPAQLADSTGLLTRHLHNLPGNVRPPFSSMGFARLSLGRDRFRQFCSEIIAKDSVERLLESHLRNLPISDSRTNEEKLRDSVSDSWLQFLEDSGLNERNPANDVIDALRPPDQNVRKSSFREGALAHASLSMNRDGLTPLEWQSGFLNYLERNKAEYLSQEAHLRNGSVRAWVAQISDQFPKYVARCIGRWGLPVVVRHLEELDREIGFYLTELANEKAELERILGSLQGSIHQALTASGQQRMPAAHPDVQTAAMRLSNGLGDFAAEIDLRNTAIEVITDFKAGLLAGLRAACMGGVSTLKEKIKVDLMPDGRINDFKNWPDALHPDVPLRFTPPPNERLLIPVDNYPAEYSRLVTETLTTEERTAERNDADKVAVKILLGDDGLNPDEPRCGFNFFTQSAAWVPTNRFFRANADESSRKAVYSLASDPQIYLDRARRWISRPSTAFGDYLNVSLAEYLSVGAAEETALMQRRNTFAQEMAGVLDAAAPLIKVNTTVLAAVHPNESATDFVTLFSVVPFANDSQMRDLFEHIITTAGLQDTEARAALGAIGESATQTIDVYSMQRKPFQPIVYDSIMTPISASWSRASMTRDGRAGFWQWRRARNLREFIPADQIKIHAMIRGWFVATALGYYRSTGHDELGPKIEIWSPNGGWLSFPHPLLYPGIAEDNQFLGTVLESLSIALALGNSNIQNPLGPLLPYKRLIELGSLDTPPLQELKQWVISGEQSSDAPIPREERAGTKDQTEEERRTALASFFNSQRINYETLFNKYIATGDPYVVQRNWEIAPYIFSDLQLLKENIESMTTEEFN